MGITFKGKEIATAIYKGKEISEMTYKGKVIQLQKPEPADVWDATALPHGWNTYHNKYLIKKPSNFHETWTASGIYLKASASWFSQVFYNNFFFDDVGSGSGTGLWPDNGVGGKRGLSVYSMQSVHNIIASKGLTGNVYIYIKDFNYKPEVIDVFQSHPGTK